MWEISLMAIKKKSNNHRKTNSKKTPAKRTENRNMIILLFLAGFIFLVVVARLFQIQVILGKEFREESYAMRAQETVVPAKRGAIYDANGVELAVDTTVYSLWIDSNYLRSKLLNNGIGKDEAATAIGSIIGAEPGFVLRKMELNSGFVWLKKEVSFEEVEGIKDLGYIGLYFQEEGSRYYPSHTAGGNLLGFVNKTGSGVAGIEATYNAILKGDDGYITGEKDGQNHFIADTIEVVKKEVPGKSIALTIDQKAQYIAEREIANIKRDLNPDSAVIMVMETKTGAILASANSNTYDPNNYKDLNSSLFTTLEYQSVFEPGSTMKILTSAAAINENVVNETTSFYDNGFRKIGLNTIKCWVFPRSHGEETLTEGMANSCNPVFVDVAMLLKQKDPNAWYRYLDTFGFGQKSTINFGGESPGILPSGNGDIYHSTSAIGQGIAVTPIQMLVAVSAIANNGQKMKPLLVKNILDTNGDILQTFEPTIEGQVVSKDTAEAVQRMMKAVVDKGTGTAFKLSNGIESLGKTGTAQKVDSTGSYELGKYVLSYVGLAPASDPKYTVFVVIDEAKKNGHVSATTAPYYKAVMEDVLALYGLSSNNQAAPNDNVLVPDLSGMTVEDGGVLLDGLGLKLVATGNGYILKQTPRAFTIVKKGREIAVVAEDKVLTENQTIVPSFMGLRLPSTISRAEGAALSLTYTGKGVVREQNPAPGTLVDKNTTVKVVLGE